MRTPRSLPAALGALALAVGSVAVLSTAPAGATTVGDEAALRAALADLTETSIVLSGEITVTCSPGELFRPASAADLVLDGAGFTITQTCPGSRVLQTASPLTARNVTITGGDETASSAAGGILALDDLTLDGVRVTGNRVGTAIGGVGGGILANGTTTIIRSSIDGNTALGGDSIFNGLGGGLAGNGTFTVTESTVAGNVSGGSATSGGGAGGVFGNGTFTFIRSTISGNVSAAATDGDGGYGAAFATNNDITLISSTVSGNRAEGTGSRDGGVRAGGNVVVVNSTIAGNSAELGAANLGGGSPGFTTSTVQNSVIAMPLGGAPNCEGQDPTANLSGGHNFADDDSCGLDDPTDIDGTGGSASLEPLAGNGGPTHTLRPAASSPLLDAIPAAACQSGGAAGTPTDQRGIDRPQLGGCDIGAVEVEGTTTPGDPGDPDQPGAPATPTVAAPTFTG